MIDAATLLTLLNTNPSGNRTDVVLRALVSALDGAPTLADAADFWPDPFAAARCEPGIAFVGTGVQFF